MAKEKKQLDAEELSASDARLIASAQNRANIQSWLRGHSGFHPVSEIADGVGLSVSSVGQLCAFMAHEGLVYFEKRGLKKYYSASEGEAAVPQTQAAVPQTRRKKSRAGKTVEFADSDIELVIAGTQMTVVAGRNPVTGRIRFTFFDTGESE